MWSSRREVDVRRVDDRRLGRRDVVAVEGDVEVAERDIGLEQVADELVQAAGEMDAAAVDADEGDGAAGVLLDDLVRDADECAADVVLVEDDFFLHVLLLPGLSGPG